jgi:hypothetical protein
MVRYSITATNIWVQFLYTLFINKWANLIGKV